MHAFARIGMKAHDPSSGIESQTPYSNHHPLPSQRTQDGKDATMMVSTITTTEPIAIQGQQYICYMQPGAITSRQHSHSSSLESQDEMTLSASFEETRVASNCTVGCSLPPTPPLENGEVYASMLPPAGRLDPPPPLPFLPGLLPFGEHVPSLRGHDGVRGQHERGLLPPAQAARVAREQRTLRRQAGRARALKEATAAGPPTQMNTVLRADCTTDHTTVSTLYPTVLHSEFV